MIDTPPSPLPVPESPEPMCPRTLCRHFSLESLDENGYAKVSEAGTPIEVAAMSEAASPTCPTALSFDDSGFAMVSDEDEEAAAMAPSKKAKKDCKRRDISVDIRAMENGTVRRVSCFS